MQKIDRRNRLASEIVVQYVENGKLINEHMQLLQNKQQTLQHAVRNNSIKHLSESTPLLIKIAEKQWILTNNHSYKYSTANQ